MTAKVIFVIHWQALRLWRKGAPYVPHPGRVIPASRKGESAVIRRIVPFALGQAGWVSVALLVREGRPFLASLVGLFVIVVNLALAPRWRRAALLVVVASALGQLVDAVLVRRGLIELPAPLGLGFVMPTWWWAFWGMFASTLPTSFAWLRGRLGLSLLLGVIGGPLSYGAGARLGAIGLGGRPGVSLAAIALEWALLMPLLVWVAERFYPLQETESP
jgi:hypothetical protein